MVNRESVVDLTNKRYESALILETIVQETFQSTLDVERLMQDPKGYLAELFVLEGMAFFLAFSERAVEIGVDFGKAVNGKK